MVLLEGGEPAGMTTGEWWETQSGSYNGSLKDAPYYVYKDSATGSTRIGSVKIPGDPFTYDDIGGGKLRVMSGPNPESIGSTFSKSERSSFLKDSETGDSSTATPAQKQSIDEIIKAIGKHVRLAVLYLARSISYSLSMKHACLNKKSTIFLPFANDLVKYTMSNRAVIEQLFTLLQTLPQNKVPNLGSIKLESPSENIKEAGEIIGKPGLYADYNESEFHLGRLKYLTKALKGKGPLVWSNVGPDASDFFVMSMDIFMDTKRFIDSAAVRKSMIANVIPIDPERGQFSTSIYGAGGSREILSFEGEEWTFDELKNEMTDHIKELSDTH